MGDRRMKKYVYLLVDEEKEVVAVYDRLDLAQKMQEPISKKLMIGKLTIEKKRVNPDFAYIELEQNG